MNKNDLKKVKLSDDDNKIVLDTLKVFVDSLQLFYAQLKANNCTQEDVKTYMFLAKHDLTEIMLKVGYNDTLIKEYKKHFKKIQRLNKKAYRLAKKRGKNISAESVTEALQRYENTFIAWYESESFSFVENYEFNPNGITCMLCNELNYEKGKLSKYSWKTDRDVDIKVQDGWDISEESYHAELLDTDNNRKRIVELIEYTFPNAEIMGFEVRPSSYNESTLNTKLYIPFSDLDQAYHLYVTDKKEA